MYRLLTEYVLKGVYLGLLAFVALRAPDWDDIQKVALCAIGGLVAALLLAAVGKLRQGYRVKGRLAAFILFLLLESPSLVYAGILLGMLGGAIWISSAAEENQLAAAAGAGAVLGVVFWLTRHVADRWVRLGLSLALAAALVGGALYWLHYHSALLQDQAGLQRVGVPLLLGIPLFYLLTFAGTAEESEVEIGAICAALGLGLWSFTPQAPTYRTTALLVPALLYVAYTMRILPGLRIFKHVIRGISHAKVGRYRPALLALRRALELDPQNTLARESLWSLHRAMDLTQVMQDPQVRDLIDLDLCLERATSLLLQPKPTPEKLAEAQRLLDLVVTQRPLMRPTIDYWRAVAHTHARQLDEAVAELEQLLDPGSYAPDDPYRRAVLLQAWQLALVLHPELSRRVGTPQLALPGRRLEAIGAVERHLAANPADASIWDLKRLLYGHLTEAEYKDATGGDRAAADFDHDYVHQLGQSLINDPAHWQRGAEYLRMAARGLLAQAPTIFVQIAQAVQRAGQPDAVWQYYELAKRAGQAVGPKNLGEQDRQTYFSVVKLLADDARAREDYAAAIENYHLYSEFERSGLETLRILADLYERRGDVFGAVRVTEQALLYDRTDKDLLERKDRYYISVDPEQLRARLDSVRASFDVDYCLQKASALLAFKNADLDVIDWAQHLASLAQVLRPDSLQARVLRARALRRKGEVDESRALLEEVYNNKPERFAYTGDEEAWFLSCRLLGEMYLYELGRPDLAVPCFQAYRKSSKSGADTLYKLGQAYEQLGDRARATKCYEHVTSYDSHPLAPDARDALYRLKSS
jgi:tetratricopeptide (TPR) repeat protein